MKKFIVLLIAVVFLISAIPGKDKEIKRPGVKLREGEGNFYNIVVSLNVGDKVTAVEEKADWTKVKTSDGKEGWVANNAFIEAKINDSFKTASLDIKNKLSSIDATASIRGVTELASNCGLKLDDKQLNKVVEDYKYIMRRKFTPQEYLTLARQYRGEVPLEKQVEKHSDVIEGEALDADSEFYAGVASVLFILTKYNLYQNYSWEQYLYYVGSQISEVVPRYDVNYIYVILDKDEALSFSTPGGFIFVTKGLLKMLKSESELAGILAHEMAHINLRHGKKMTEAPDSAYRNKQADKAFDEFDKEFEELSEKGVVKKENVAKIKKFQEEFCDVYEGAFKVFMQPRFAKDELEADAFAVFYMYKAGYSPQGFINFLERAAQKENKNSFASYSELHPSFKERLDRIEKAIKMKKVKKAKNYEQLLSSRYMKKMGFLK